MKNLFKHISYLSVSIIVTLIFFMFLPVSYYLFSSKMNDTLGGKRVKRVTLDSLSISKPKEKKIIKRKDDQHITKDKIKSFSNMMKLDLTVLSDDNSEGFVNKNGNNVIEDYEADEPPIKKNIITPGYPKKAREEGIECIVKIKMRIDERGVVREIIFEKVMPHWGFEEAVRRAVTNWQFEPAVKNNFPVSVWARQEINFSL